MAEKIVPSFGRLRNFFWPVHRHEAPKLLPLFFILFLICFNYSILRNIKDTVIITAQGSGAEVIPFIKVWILLPMAIFFTWIFTKLSNHFCKINAFYILIGAFISYFLLFAFVLYPNNDALKFSSLAMNMQAFLPEGLYGFVSMIENWSLSGFYVLCEIWSCIIIGVLFWGLSNEINQLREAKRFYGVLNIGSTISAIIAGQTAIFFTQKTLNPLLPFGNTPWEQTLSTLVLIITCSSIITIFCLRYIQVHIYQGKSPSNSTDPHKKKIKISIRESLKQLRNSKYLMCLAILVISYNLGINLIEIVWKSKVKELYPSPQDFNRYLNVLTSTMGVFSTISSFLIPIIIARIGWTFLAMITPFIMLITGAGFFSFLLFPEDLTLGLSAFLGASPLAVAVLFGSANNVLSKASKYSVFDASKEIAFVPLPEEMKLKGKAAIDGIGSRFGKSGGSFIQQGLLMAFGSLAACTPYLGGILAFLITAWIFATYVLGKHFSLFQENIKSEEKQTNKPSPAMPTL